MATQEATRYEVIDQGAWITLNRPEQRNALTSVLVTELLAHLRAANHDPEVRCIVLTGAGSAFCAGADLKDPPGQRTDGQAAVTMPEVMTYMMESEKPVIVAVNGAAFAGGLGLVGAADIAVCVDAATLSFSEVRIGVIPAIIAVVCVPKIGRHHAMRLFLTGERFSGTEAVALGLVHRAVAASELVDAVNDVVRMICLGGPNAVIECKKLVRRASDLDFRSDMGAGFEEMAALSLRMFKSDEAAEGMSAFREKRKPAWVED